MSRDLTQRIHDYTLVFALEDYVAVDELYAIGRNGAKRTGTRFHSAQLELPLKRMLDSKSIEIVSAKGSFKPWPLDGAETMQRVSEFLLSHPSLPEPSYEFWIFLTQKGQEAAKRIIQEFPEILDDEN